MNLFFDECIPPKWFRDFAQMLRKRKDPVMATHILDKLESGEDDETVTDWVLKQDPHMMMVSGDTGRKTKGASPRMHLLCPKKGITSVFVAPKLCQRDGFEKVRMMMVCMPELERSYDGPKGTRYRIIANRDHYRIEKWPPRSVPIPPTPP